MWALPDQNVCRETNFANTRDGSSHLQTSFEDVIKIGNPQQLPLKLTDKSAVQVINALKQFREGSCSLLELKLKEPFVKFAPEIKSCACRWKSQ